MPYTNSLHIMQPWTLHVDIHGVLLHNYETDGAHLTYQRVLFLVSEILLAEDRGGGLLLE